MTSTSWPLTWTPAAHIIAMVRSGKDHALPLLQSTT
jgi:hypothetical protein